MKTPLNLPKAPLKLVRKPGGIYVWCIIRKKELLLTPEEWVRQHVIHFLINEKQFPVGLIASEYSLVYNGIAKRADIVVFDRSTQPVLIVECKAPEISLSEATVRQIAQYNYQLGVDFLLLTNGINHVVCKIDRNLGKMRYLEELPSYEEIIG